jgi:hypothetical protein
MKGTLRSVLAAVGGVLAVALVMPAPPARTQDRGTAVIVANTPAEPVPAQIVNRDPVSTSPSNDPGRPLFVAPGDRATFNVCPVSCGAYQVYGAAVSGGVGATVQFEVPSGMRFTIKYVSVEASRQGVGGIRAYLWPAFSVPGGVEQQIVYLPVGFQTTAHGRSVYHGSFPVSVHHDSIAGGKPLTAFTQALGVDAEARLAVLVSGVLEPLQQP